MASPTLWTWVWVNSGSWWWTGRPGVLQSMGSQIVGHDWAPELNELSHFVVQQKWTQCGKSAMCLSVSHSCLTLCDPMDCSLQGSSLYEILQARILEWESISLFRRSSRSRDWTWVFCTAGRFFTIWAIKNPYGGMSLFHFRTKTPSSSLVCRVEMYLCLFTVLKRMRRLVNDMANW